MAPAERGGGHGAGGWGVPMWLLVLCGVVVVPCLAALVPEVRTALA
jgi:hypothetical protein